MAGRREDFSSNGTTGYDVARVSVSDDTDEPSVNTNTDGPGHEYLAMRPSLQDDVICNSCGLLRDRFGYLILTAALGGQTQRDYYRPVPPPRPGVSPVIENQSPDSFKASNGPSRISIIFISFLILLLAGSIGGNIYQFLQKSSETEVVQAVKTLCPDTVSLQPGQSGEIRCSIQYYKNTSSLSIDMYFIGGYTTDTQTYLSQETLTLPSGSIQKELLDTKVDVSANNDGNLEIVIQYDQVKCCHRGYVYVNISGSLMLTIDVNVEVNMPCQQSVIHTIGEINSLLCTRCICGNISSLSLNGTAWYYSGPTFAMVVQPERISQHEYHNESMGITSYELEFNRTACFDHGLYILETIDNDNQKTQYNFTVRINGYDQNSPNESQETVTLLTIRRISIEICIDNTPMAFLYGHSLVYSFTGNDDTVEFLRAENISVSDQFRLGSIGVIAAGQQNMELGSHSQRSLQIRTTYSYGVTRFDLDFNKVQCFHGGQYLFFRNGSVLYNLTVTPDDILERTQTEIYQKSEVTGFVETYNITMECAARVGCTKRPYLMNPEIGSNTTYDYSLMDVNADDTMDLFIATINTTVVNISMTLNDTSFNCKVTEDDVTQEQTYQIYVLEGTFCDSRPKNCEYFYPYQTLQTCKQWVSCLDDRPRVKFCDFNNLYYHKTDGQCEGRCEIGCPWNL